MEDTSLQCPICFERFNNPVMLPCQHCFCWNCIPRNKKTELECPLCRKSFRENEFKRNLMLEQILDHNNPSTSNPKPSDASFPKSFDLGGPSRSQQQTQNKTEDDWGPTLLAGAAGLLVGAIGTVVGMKLSSATKRKK